MSKIVVSLSSNSVDKAIDEYHDSSYSGSSSNSSSSSGNTTDEEYTSGVPRVSLEVLQEQLRMRAIFGVGTSTSIPSSPPLEEETVYNCWKVEFNQPSCWLYSVPNLLVFQRLVTLYLGGFVVRVVSEIECWMLKSLQENRVLRVTRGCKPPEAAHVPGMLKVEAAC